jgi:hypothetical protein
MAVEDIGAHRPAEIDLPDRYRDRPRLASSESEPGVEATYRIRNAGNCQVRRRDIFSVFRERLSGCPGDHIALTSEDPSHFFDARKQARPWPVANREGHRRAPRTNSA